jgi:hypothetical protein
MEILVVALEVAAKIFDVAAGKHDETRDKRGENEFSAHKYALD